MEVVNLGDTMVEIAVEVSVARAEVEVEEDSEAIIEETVEVVDHEEASADVAEAIRDRLVLSSTAS